MGTALSLKRAPGTAPFPATALDRSARAAAILAVVAAPTSDAGFNAVVETLVGETWERSVVARARAVAPDFLAGPFVPKLRAGFSTYCALGLSAIACSRRRPRAIGVAGRVARAVGLGERGLAALARPAMPRMYRLLCARELDAIAVASAFILVVDEIFDDELSHLSGRERIRAVDRIVHGHGDIASPAGVLALRLVEDLRALRPDAWPAMAARLVEWADAEVRLEEGDPRIEPRKAGIDVSMELLAFAAPAYVGDRELAWMCDIARLGQMVDDVLDLEKDLAAGRVTLAATGSWTVETVHALHARLVEETRALIADAGERPGPVLALYEQTFRAQIRHMAEVLVANP